MNDSMPTVIKAQSLSKYYPHVSGPVSVLTDLNLEVRSGEVLAIIGKSGSGKSTLLHILGTLDEPSSGQVQVLSQDVFSMKDPELSAFRNRHIGFVFQFHHLLPEFTALENTVLPALIHGTDPATANAQATRLLDMVDLSHRLQHRPAELSGGEQQRVALARSLVMSPDIVLADEPTGNLDPRTGSNVHDLFLSVSRDLNTTVIVATHNPDLAARSDRCLSLVEGRLAEAE